MLRLLNDTAYLRYEQIHAMFTKYPQIVFTDAPDLQLVRDTEGTFVRDPEGVYITDAKDTVHGYAGATYIFGAATVYDVAGTLQRLGCRFGRRVIRLRILHEILHHYSLDADGLERWFIAEKHVFMSILYRTIGRSSGETWIGSAIQEIYYRFLIDAVDIERIEEEHNISSRTYQGLEQP